MGNRIDDQTGDRDGTAAPGTVPNGTLRRFGSGAWWRAVAEHYGPSAAKVSSTLAFAFAIGIGLGVVLASGLDDSGDYEYARAGGAEPADVTETASRAAQPEPPYSISVSVRETTGPAAAQIGETLDDVPLETFTAETQATVADMATAEAEAVAAEAATEPVADEPADTVDAKTSVSEAPETRQVAEKPVGGASPATADPAADSKDIIAVLLETGADVPSGGKAVDPPVAVTPPVGKTAAADADAVALAADDSDDVDSLADDTVGVDADIAGVTALSGRKLAALPGPRDATWLRHAVRTARQPGKAMIAIVIDDLGIDQKRTRRAIDMPGPMTMSFIPYGYNLARLTDTARAAGHEILLHLPMEPLARSTDPGPHAMLTSLSAEELQRRLVWNLARMDGYVGVNNHMGSRFTAWRPGMQLVMREIRERGLLFLDSWTNKRSYGVKLAREVGVPNAVRDVFIDHDIDAASIGKRLRQLESIAHRRGFAIGIGHPYDLTVKLLPAWMAEAEARGIQFVPISTIVQRRLTAG